MIIRSAEKKLQQLARSFKALAVVGPRQSGKTTRVKTLFKNKPYVSFAKHKLRGVLFESMVLTEFVKQRANAGLPINL